MSKIQKCVVTGGKGFIGQNLVRELVKRGKEVVVIDNESAPEHDNFIEHEGATYYNLDIRSPEISILFNNADVVFHLAAHARIQPSFNKSTETFSNNVVGTQNILEISAKQGVKAFVFSSSSSIYGRQTGPFTETMDSQCLSPYSLSKKMGEDLCRLCALNKRMNIAALRYFNVYGPGEPVVGVYAPVVGKFKRQKLKNEPLTIVGRGKQSRDFTHVDDVVDANLKAASYLLGQKGFAAAGTFRIFNIGTGKSITIESLARLISQNVRYVPERLGESFYTCSDPTRANLQLGWKASKRIEEEVNKY